MKKAIDELTSSLDDLAIHIINSWGDERKLNEFLGVQFAPITKRDIAKSVEIFSTKLKQIDYEIIDPDLKGKLNQFAQSANHIKTHIVPQMFNGNNPAYLPRYYEFIESLRVNLSPVLDDPRLDWTRIEDQEMLPHKLRRKLRNYNASISSINQQIGTLESKISLINSAHEAAESLPADLQDLRSAREVIAKSTAAAEVSKAKIERNEVSANELIEQMTTLKQQAESLVDRCEEAYRITTTKGLAAAFDEKAKKLAWSMWVWVFGLISSLAGGAYFGSYRVGVLSKTLVEHAGNTPLAVMQIIVAVFSVGAPLWFAWIATKQIGQRFRLSEDYAFKASVSKAYEGYRKEANRLDNKFESRLFDSALQRLDEAPLRLVESETHGSPWHELINSKSFQKALNKVPNIGDRIDEYLKKRPEKNAQADK